MPLKKYKGADKSDVKEYAIEPNYVEVKFSGGDTRNFNDKTHGPMFLDKLKSLLDFGKYAGRLIQNKLSSDEKNEVKKIHEKKESSYSEWKERRKCKDEKEC